MLQGKGGKAEDAQPQRWTLQFSQLLQAPGGRLAGAVFSSHRTCSLPFHWAELRWHGSFLT